MLFFKYVERLNKSYVIVNICYLVSEDELFYDLATFDVL